MKRLYFVVFAFLILVLSFLISFPGLASASSPVLQPVNYNFSNFSVYHTVNVPSFGLRVETPPGSNVTNCSYSTTPLPFANMSALPSSGGGVYYKDINNLGDSSVNNYYIRCVNSTVNESQAPTVHLQVNVDLPVTASIEIPNAPTFTNPPTLSSGRFEINLYTSKQVQNIPTLTYSFDGGKTIINLPLFGSGREWQGYLVIPGDTNMGAVSFCFNAVDLNGISANSNTGSSCGKITSGGVFPIDTQKPPMITDIVAAGSVGEIALNWNLNANNVAYYNIYRSTSPGVQYTDLYASNISQDSYYDYGALKGQTYYYRVAAVDEAGNIADLSKEVSSTSLRDNTTNTSTSLSPQLVGQVENFLVQADSVLSNIKSIKTSLNSKSQEIQQLFSNLGFTSQLDQATSQINGIESDAKTLELQDLTQQELTAQIDSLEVKLGAAKKQIPEDIAILDQGSDSYVPSANDITRAMLEFNSSLPQSEVSQGVQNSLNYVKSSNMKINSHYYNIQVTYLDGSTSYLSVVSRQITGQVERMDNAYFIETVPKEIASSASDINVEIGSYNTVQSDPVLSFGTDTKNIFYYVYAKDNISALQNTQLSFIMLPNSTSGVSITGNFLKIGSGTATYGGIGTGVFLAIALMVYFMFLKNRKISEKGKEVMNLIEKINENIKKGDDESFKSLYKELKEKYKGLDKREKKLFYENVKDLYKNSSGGINGNQGT